MGYMPHEVYAHEVHDMRCTLVRCMPMMCTPLRCTPMRCTPVRCMPIRCMTIKLLQSKACMFVSLDKHAKTRVARTAWRAVGASHQSLHSEERLAWLARLPGRASEP